MSGSGARDAGTERRTAADPVAGDAVSPIAGNVYIGISGWRYPPWRAVFYPRGLPQRDELAYAAQRFSTIEINGSFYSLQRPEYYAEWRAQTPPGFLFAVKGPRFITHILKLRDVDQALANFFASGVANLGDKLGPFLWQLPPNLGFDPTRVERFLALLPRDTDQAAALARKRDAKVRGRARLAWGARRPLRHALEVRHSSFVDPALIRMLRKHEVALVVADTAGKWPVVEDVTADFLYLRLHGDKELYVSGYSVSALQWWARRIASWRVGGEPDDARRIDDRASEVSRPRDVFCYFDNDAKVKAPRDARRLARLVNGR